MWTSAKAPSLAEMEAMAHDIFERLPKAKTSEIKALTPAAWLKARHAATRQSA